MFASKKNWITLALAGFVGFTSVSTLAAENPLKRNRDKPVYEQPEYQEEESYDDRNWNQREERPSRQRQDEQATEQHPAVPLMIDLMNENAQVRERAARKLMQMREAQQLVQEAYQMTNSQKAEDQFIAAVFLAHVAPSPEVAAYLVQFLGAQPTDLGVVIIMESLGRMGEHASGQIDVIRQVANAKNPAYREAAQNALAKLGAGNGREDRRRNDDQPNRNGWDREEEAYNDRPNRNGPDREEESYRDNGDFSQEEESGSNDFGFGRMR